MASVSVTIQHEPNLVVVSYLPNAKLNDAKQAMKNVLRLLNEQAEPIAIVVIFDKGVDLPILVTALHSYCAYLHNMAKQWVSVGERRCSRQLARKLVDFTKRNQVHVFDDLDEMWGYLGVDGSINR